MALRMPTTDAGFTSHARARHLRFDADHRLKRVLTSITRRSRDAKEEPPPGQRNRLSQATVAMNVEPKVEKSDRPQQLEPKLREARPVKD